MYNISWKIDILRSSHQRCSIKKGFLKLSQYSQKTPCVGALLDKSVDMKGFSFIKKRLQQRCSPVNIEKFLRTPTLKNTIERLLLFTVFFYGENDGNNYICVYISQRCLKPHTLVENNLMVAKSKPWNWFALQINGLVSIW